MLSLRYYQTAAVDAVYGYFAQHEGNPLIVLPTGTGKSLTLAEFIRRSCTMWPGTRILVLTHVKELIEQDYMAILKLWPQGDIGIYSAGLNKRNLGSKVTVGGIQSLYKKATQLGHIDIIAIDEAHLLSPNSETMYGTLIAGLKAINPHLRVMGLTATPYRLNQGMLTDGESALFHAVAYDYSVRQAIEDGFLCEPIPRRTLTKLDVSDVGTRGGEFIAGQLEDAIDIDETTRAIADEVAAQGVDRKSWLFFCAGVKHAYHMRDAVRALGISCESVTGDTPNGERASILARFKAGQVRALTNANVLTTGFDAPAIDLIAMVRPTKSTGLYVQMIGRGTRLSPGKDNCLVLDFAGNTLRHGPIDRIEVRTPGGGGGEAPVKECPSCFTYIFAGMRVCPHCKYKFPEPKPEITPTAKTEALLSTQELAQWADVTDVVYQRHMGSSGVPTLRVSYYCGLASYSEWVCVEHEGFARQKAVRWWRRRDPVGLVPGTIDDAVKAAQGLPMPKRIAVQREGKFLKVVGEEF